MPHLTQPGSAQLSEEVLEEILASLALSHTSVPEAVVHRDHFSNDFTEIRLRNGRTIIVKRGRFEWTRPRFDTSRAASKLIRRKTGLTVPAPLPLPSGLEDPLEAYWRIDVPTLMEVWPSLDRQTQRTALRSWGTLAGELHSVETLGFGPLTPEASGHGSVADFLRRELMDRLLPAVVGEWPESEGRVYALAEAADEVGARVGGHSRLIHGDLHMGNVLCDPDRHFECVGLIDLETAQAAPPEAELAVMEIHHGELFDHALDGEWLPVVLEGYGHPLDPWVVNFYRAFHLLNMGFYSNLIGHGWHADRVGEALDFEIELLGRTR